MKKQISCKEIVDNLNLWMFDESQSMHDYQPEDCEEGVSFPAVTPYQIDLHRKADGLHIQFDMEESEDDYELIGSSIKVTAPYTLVEDEDCDLDDIQDQVIEYAEKEHGAHLIKETTQ